MKVLIPDMRLNVLVYNYSHSSQWPMRQHSNQITFLVHVRSWIYTVYPKKYAHGFCFAVLCCGYTLTDFPISIRLTSLALWQSNDCPSASKATLMNMDKYFMWIHYERLHNHNKAKHNKTVCIFIGIYCRAYGSFLLTCFTQIRTRVSNWTLYIMMDVITRLSPIANIPNTAMDEYL